MPPPAFRPPPFAGQGQTPSGTFPMPGTPGAQPPMTTPPAGSGAGTATLPPGQGQPNVNPATGLVSPVQPVTPNPTEGGVPFNQGAVPPNQSAGTTTGTGTTSNGTGTTPPNSFSGQAVTPARPSFDSSGAIRTPQGSLVQPVSPNPTTGGVPFNQGAVPPNQSGFAPGQTDTTGGTTTGPGTGTTNNGTGTTNNGTDTTSAPNSFSGQAVTPTRPSFDSSGASRNPQGSTNSAASPSNPSGSGTPSNNASQLSTDVLLRGLADVRVSNLSNLNGGDVVNISTSFNKVQIQALEQSLKANASAQSNAQIMTQMMQQRGLMARDQVVVGFMGGKVYVASASEVR